MSSLKLYIPLALMCLTLFGNGASAAAPGRIYVQGTKLMVDARPIYLNGANTPWHFWNEFGSENGNNYDHAWWNSEFARLKAKGINSVRIWISCDGTEQPQSNSSGVSSVSSKFWSDMDDLMGLASVHHIYVMATMVSFDHVKPWTWDPVTNAHSTIFNNWLAVYNTSAGVQTILDQYIVPFVKRYKDNPYLFAIDLCNEPEWMSENYGSVTVANMQRYVARAAAAIHRSGSQVLVTVGSASIKWNSEKFGIGNYWSDANLQKQFVDNQAFLDFYQIHYYIWMEPYYPLRTSAVNNGITDKPLVMGELPAAATEVNNNNARLLPVGETLESLFEYFLANGYSGHYPWTSNDFAPTDLHYTGSLTDFGAAALAFQQDHTNIVIMPETNTIINAFNPPNRGEDLKSPLEIKNQNPSVNALGQKAETENIFLRVYRYFR
jgi:hypothetical protein